MEISTSGFFIGGKFLCKKFFCELSKVSPYILKEVFKALSMGQKFFVHGNTVGMRQSSSSIGFVVWLKNFATNYGNFAPDEQVIVISACFTIKEMYLMYKIQAPAPLVGMSTFYALFQSKFGARREDPTLPHVRLSSYTTHSRCDQVSDLNNWETQYTCNRKVFLVASLLQVQNTICQKANCIFLRETCICRNFIKLNTDDFLQYFSVYILLTSNTSSLCSSLRSKYYSIFDNLAHIFKFFRNLKFGQKF